MKKKLFSMLMVCVLAVCLCVPAFAAQEEAPAQLRAGALFPLNTLYRVKSTSNGQMLNADAPSWRDLKNDQNVNTWPNTGDETQTWYAENLGHDQFYLSCAGTQWALNIKNRAMNCDVVRIADNHPNDYTLIRSGTSGYHYYVRLANRSNIYLNATPNTVYGGKGYNVNWSQHTTTKNSHYWDFVVAK